MIKYRTVMTRIEAVNVIKETKHCVFLPSLANRGPLRELKRSDWQNWFDTWGEAKSFLIEKAEKEVEAARLQLERARGKLLQIRGLRKSLPRSSSDRVREQ